MNASAVICSRTIRAAVGIAVASAIVWSAASAALAQQNPLVAQKGAISRILRGKSLGNPQNAKLFDDYFNRFLRQFGNKSPGPATFHLLRKDLRTFRLTGKSGQAYDMLNSLAYRYMRAIVLNEKFHPAARVNAVLVLGDLNEAEKAGGKPYARTYPILAGVAKMDRFPDELKVAAMVGLKRWAALEAVPAKQQAALSGAMLKLLNEETPPAGRTAEGHNWMRRGAAEILAALGNPGPNNEVVAAYEKIVANSAARNTLRCEIAESLGKLKYPQGSKVDFPSLANLIGHQTVEICQRELDADRRNPRRRLLAYALRSALLGLEGANRRGGLKAASSGTDGQQFVDAVWAPIDAAYKTAVDEDLDDTAVGNAVDTMIAELQPLLRNKPVPKPDTVAAGQDALPAEQPDAQAAAGAPSSAGN